MASPQDQNIPLPDQDNNPPALPLTDYVAREQFVIMQEQAAELITEVTRLRNAVALLEATRATPGITPAPTLHDAAAQSNYRPPAASVELKYDVDHEHGLVFESDDGMLLSPGSPLDPFAARMDNPYEHLSAPAPPRLAPVTAPSSAYLDPRTAPLAPPLVSHSPAFNRTLLPPPPPLAPVVHKSKRKPLPMGQPFNGDKDAFQSWKLTITHKLKADAEFIGDNRDQCAFIWASLGARVQAVIASYYAAEETHFWLPERFLEYLDFVYRDQHAKTRARSQLDALRQGNNESFPDFFVRFEQLLLQAGCSLWDDDLKLHRLRSSLQGNIRDIALNRGVVTNDYESAIAAYKQIAVDIEQRTLEAHAVHTPHTSAPSSASRRDHDGDTPMSNVNNMSLLEDCDGAPKRRNWIPETIFKDRRARGVCTRCNASDHNHRECPNAVKINIGRTLPRDTALVAGPGKETPLN